MDEDEPTALFPKYIIDTSAWIEYFKGSDKGRLFIDKIELAENYTPSIVLAEISGWFTSHRKKNFKEFLDFIRQKSVIIKEIDEDIAVRGGEIKGTDDRKKKSEKRNERSMSYIDGILIAIAEKMEITLITLDSHFRNFQYCEYMGKSG